MVDTKHRQRDQAVLARCSVTSLSLYYGENGSKIGSSQLCMVLLTVVADCHVSCCLFYFVFEASHQGWTCPSNHNVTSSNMTSLIECTCSSREFSREYTSPATEFDLVCERRSLAKLMTSAYFVGSIVGSVIGGHLGDRYGRKMLALIMWTLMTASMALTSLAPSWQVYTGLRFLTGLGGGPVSGSLMVLCCEYVGSRWRTLVSSQMGFAFGSLLATFMTYFMCWNWRYLTLTMALAFAPFIMVAVWSMPESARLLLLQGHVNRAHAQLSKVARHNKMAAPDLDTIKQAADKEQKLQADRKYHSIADLFRGETMATTTLTVLLCWLATSFVSFGLKSSISDVTGNLYTNSIIGFAGSIPCRIVTIIATNSFGRRWCYVIVTSTVTVALVTVTVMKSSTMALTYPSATSVVAMVGNAISDGNWIVVNLFATELYTTQIRNIAVGVVYMVSRTGASIAPFILLLDTFHKSIPYVIFAVMEVSSVGLSLTLRETVNRPLIDTASYKAADNTKAAHNTKPTSTEETSGRLSSVSI